MTGVDISVNCGCGYTTKSLEAAERHSNSTGHRMTISGSITPVDAGVSKAKGNTGKTPRAEPAKEPKPSPGLAAISALRDKFNSKH